MARREVRASDRFVAEARARFPTRPTSDGRPTYAQLAAGPLAGAIEQFARQFDELPEAVEGTAIKVVMTAPVPLFGPLVFYAILGTDDVVELVSLLDDPDYGDLIGDDPGD